MTPNQLKKILDKVYGWGGQSALARDLDINPRTVRSYVAGEQPIPRTVELAVKYLELRSSASAD